jgi:hypothetical protein
MVSSRAFIVPARRTGERDRRHLGMNHSWYVTFEVSTDGTLPRRRHPRLTQTFEAEAAAKGFARAKFNEGLIVTAGTILPPSAKGSDPVGGNSCMARKRARAS